MAFIAKPKGFLIGPEAKWEASAGTAHDASLENYHDRNDGF